MKIVHHLTKKVTGLYVTKSYVAVFDQVNHLIYALKSWHGKSWTAPPHMYFLHIILKLNGLYHINYLRGSSGFGTWSSSTFYIHKTGTSNMALIV